MLLLPRIDLLIKSCRSKSLNEDYGDNYGIQDSFFLEALNDCLSDIQQYMVLSQTHPFSGYADIPAVSQQEGYLPPDDIFAPNLIYDVLYANDSTLQFQPLSRSSSYRRDSSCMGMPEEWLADAGMIWLAPVPDRSGGTIRVQYERKLDSLDLRRGQVLSATVTNGVLVELTIDPDSSSFDADTLQDAEFLCLNSSLGNVTCRNIQVDSIDSETGIVAISGGGFTLPASAGVSIGDYACCGRDTTTHAKLPIIFKSYFVNYAQNEVNIEQSSTDTDETNPKLEKQLMAVAELYASMPGGTNPIPQQRGGW